MSTDNDIHNDDIATHELAEADVIVAGPDTGHPSAFKRALWAAADAMTAEQAEALKQRSFATGGGTLLELAGLGFSATPMEHDGGPDHGVKATLRIEPTRRARCVLHVEKANGDVVDFGECASITFSVFGNRENFDLVNGLIELGKRLEPLAAARLFNR